MPARVPTFLSCLREAVSGGMGREVGNRRQKYDFRGLDEPKLFLCGAPFQHAAISPAVLK